MRIYAAGDLHLSKSGEKPMDIFGEAWRDHDKRICESWRELVKDEDIVLVPGDLSWAMKLKDAVTDLHDIMLLPGRKVFIRGNHDYWWNGYSKVCDAFAEFKNAYFLQNNAVTIDGISFAGTRGWLCPGSTEYKKDRDEQYYLREILRCEMAVKCMDNSLPKVLLLHYPPFADPHVKTGFEDIVQKYGVKNVVYGHLHGYAVRQGFTGEKDGVRYDLCSLDAIGFAPLEIHLAGT